MANGVHFRTTRAEINRSALAHNAKIMQNLSAPAHLLGVVKADAYGHGMLVAARAIDEHVDAFAVAFIDEALLLREAGFIKPIVLLEGCFSAAELPICAHYNLQPVVHEQSQLDAIATTKLVRPLSVWLKVDTGMHRLGWDPERVAAVYAELSSSPQVTSITLMSHFANSGEDEHPVTQLQRQRFAKACAQTRILNQSFGNSAALTSSLKDYEQLSGHWLRAGVTLYGVNPDMQKQVHADLRPVMRLVAPVIALRQIAEGERVGYGSSWLATRPSLIATLAIGYADGYPRHCKSGTPVLIHGQKAPLAGTVSMDMITVDVTDIEGIQVGDEAELWGPHLSVHEIAEHAGTIGYELLTRVSTRVPRVEI